jgi:hypothetical protein
MTKLIIEYRNFFAVASVLVVLDNLTLDNSATIIALSLCYFELTRIRNSVRLRNVFTKDFFAKGEDVVCSGKPPSDTIKVKHNTPA